MTKKGYALDGLHRLSRALPDLDQRTLEIIAYHLHLERELDRALTIIFPRPERLKLGFTQKVSVLEAHSASSWMDSVGKALLAFNSLRNAAAHKSNSAAVIDGCFMALCKACAAMTGVAPDVTTATVGGLAAAITGALGVDMEVRAPSTSQITPELLSLRLDGTGN